MQFNEKGVFMINSKIKKITKILIYIQITYCMILGFLINDLHFPGVFKYITDIIMIILLKLTNHSDYADQLFRYP